MHIENRSGTHVVVYEDESCHPANDDEIAMWGELTTLSAENERLSGDLAFFDNRCPKCNSTLGLLHESECPLCSSRARVAGLEEALTPSAETKAAYIGEFSFCISEFDEDGEEFARVMDVPWTTIKDIMKAIARRALGEK